MRYPSFLSFIFVFFFPWPACGRNALLVVGRFACQEAKIILSHQISLGCSSCQGSHTPLERSEAGFLAHQAFLDFPKTPGLFALGGIVLLRPLWAVSLVIHHGARVNFHMLPPFPPIVLVGAFCAAGGPGVGTSPF